MNIQKELPTILTLIGGVLILVTIVSIIIALISKKRLNNIIKQMDISQEKIKQAEQKLRKAENELLKIQKNNKDIRDSMQDTYSRVPPNNKEIIKSPEVSVSKQQSSNKTQEIINSVIGVYEEQRINDVFVPLPNLITGLVARKIVSKEDFAIELINRLAQRYPSAFRIEEIRGKSGKYIAIYKERIVL